MKSPIDRRPTDRRLTDRRLRAALVVASLLAAASCVGIALVTRPARIAEPDPAHWITPAMAASAESLSGERAPNFRRRDSDGDELDLRELCKKGPVVLLFILDGCPCSIEAEPFYQRLASAYAGKVAFVGVTDGGLAAAREWKAHFQAVYPLISDPSKDIMRAYRARQSAYVALVGRDGRLVKLWPGFDQALLNEMNGTLADACDEPGTPIDFSDAPTKPTSGCFFY